jgi:hypothetical protein
MIETESIGRIRKLMRYVDGETSVKFASSEADEMKRIRLKWILQK